MKNKNGYCKNSIEKTQIILILILGIGTFKFDNIPMSIHSNIYVGYVATYSNSYNIKLELLKCRPKCIMIGIMMIFYA